ncbi:MAG TPA: hypothetical protein EYP59_16570 [Thiotrichaceae bacterium]|nr:hypothetical protein [Thiotrichaceae bacterium]
MIIIDEQTRYKAVSSNYAGIEQRWIIVHSCQAEKRAKRTINRQCLKASTANLKAFKHLCNKIFSSEEEAQKALQKFEKNYSSPQFKKLKLKRCLVIKLGENQLRMPNLIIMFTK